MDDQIKEENTRTTRDKIRWVQSAILADLTIGDSRIDPYLGPVIDIPVEDLKEWGDLLVAADQDLENLGLKREAMTMQEFWEAADIETVALRPQIITLLGEAPQPLTAQQVRDALGQDFTVVALALGILRRDGHIRITNTTIPARFAIDEHAKPQQ